MSTNSKKIVTYTILLATLLIVLIVCRFTGIYSSLSAQWQHITHIIFCIGLLLTVFGIKEIRRDDLKLASSQRIIFTILAIALLFTALFC
jgi:energy-converting hydrogenase Eha subunit C